MRGTALLLLGAILASCTTSGPAAGDRTPEKAQELATLLAGKTAAPTINCLPSYNSNDQRIIDGRTVAFRVGSRTTYLMRLSQGCNLLGTGNYALLSRQIGGVGMCQGDIVRVVDLFNRMTVGSCGIESITPYSATGSRY
jgi:uncharacterized protein DUF6491